MDECVSPVNVVFRSFICVFFLLQHGFYKMKRTVFTITLERLSKYYTNLLALPIFFFIVRIAKARLSLKSDNTKHVLYQNCNFSISITTTLDVDVSPNYLNWHFSRFLCSNALIEKKLTCLKFVWLLYIYSDTWYNWDTFFMKFEIWNTE